MQSYARVLEFVKRSSAVSPTVALETATALQVMMSICISKCLRSHYMVTELNL